MNRLLVLLLGLAACTSSRAVQLAREGWQAEQRGQISTAVALYERACDLDAGLVTTQLAWIRLRAQTPEGREDARQALDKLLKKKPEEPRVAAFAAVWALWQGDAKLAEQRLAAARPLKSTDTPDVAAGLGQARWLLATSQGQWSRAQELAAELTPSVAQAERLAVVAWNSGHPAEARRALASVAGAGDRTLMGALLLAEGKAAEAQTALAAAPVSVQSLTLRARALLAAGQPREAQALAADAARRDAGDLAAAEVWAVSLLQSGQPQQARDVLAGLTVRGAGWTVWHHLGLAHLTLGDVAAAQQAFAGAASRGASPSSQRNAELLGQLIGH